MAIVKVGEWTLRLNLDSSTIRLVISILLDRIVFETFESHLAWVEHVRAHYLWSRQKDNYVAWAEHIFFSVEQGRNIICLGGVAAQI